MMKMTGKTGKRSCSPTHDATEINKQVAQQVVEDQSVNDAEGLEEGTRTIAAQVRYVTDALQRYIDTPLQ